MIYLGIETCFAKASASLLKNGVIITKEEGTLNNQSNALTEMVKNLLMEGGVKPQDITAVLTNKGPGSFTGVRVGLSFVEGFCFGGKMQKLYLSSFATALGSLKDCASVKKDILVILHAIRGTFYVQKFSFDVKEVSRPEYLSFSEVKDKIETENLQPFGSFSGYDFGVPSILNDAELNSKNIINSFLNFPHLIVQDPTPLYLRNAVN